MRRHRGDSTPTGDPVARATAVGLPSFNFIEPRKPQDAKKKPCIHTAQLSTTSPLSPQLPALTSGGRTPRQDQQQQHQEATALPEETGIINVDVILDAAIRARTAQMRDTTM